MFRSIWMPVALYFSLSSTLTFFQNAWYASAIYGIGFGGIAAWEFLVSKRYSAAAIILLVSTLTFGLQMLPDLEGYIGREDGRRFWLEAYNLLVYVLILTVRFYLAGSRKAIKAGLITGMIYFLFPRINSHVGSWLLDWSRTNFLADLWPYITILVLTFYKALSYYVIIFLTEQILVSRLYIERLFSKVQVLTTWEYLPLFFTTWWVFMAGVAELANNIRELSEPGFLQLRHSAFFAISSSLAAGLFIYTGAALLRNIIVSRSLTINRRQTWLYILHYIPVVNVIPVWILATTPEENDTVEKNIDAYRQTFDNWPGKMLIWTGILLTIYQVYELLTVPTGMRWPAFGCLGLIYLLKIAAYIALPKYKQALWAVIILQAASITFTLSDFFLLYLAFTYLGYYLLREIYYPQLASDDRSFVIEAYADS
ncbi:hypothetical protein KTO58_25755 [Chitinophaga pendula]|uniref:hypothetical protein n=1 Tax=Chitinophaga TaxID=79328 RepID=UPI0012FD1A21|nr:MULTISPECIES: hypothetical protein [Chitinophaga]UCJ07032.1 hypothetical protein KTO58_25755 [Chitinophaga pendula]